MEIINFKKVLKSLRIGFLGLWTAFKKEHSFRVGIFIAIVVSFFVFYFPLSAIERAIIFLTIFNVLSIELLNTQIERTINLINSNHSPTIKIVKDIVAGAALLIVIGAGVVAYFIFLPHIMGH